MKQDYAQTASKMRADRKRRNVWQRVVSSLVMVVVFCTTYALILPAITMHSDAVCGIQAHTHTEECYQIVPVQKLVCDTVLAAEPVAEQDTAQDTTEAAEHVHSELCWEQTEETETLLICQLEEHTHDESCFQIEEQTAQGMVYHCGYAAHFHGDTCCDENGEMTCSIPEHTHTAQCVLGNVDLTLDVEYAYQWEYMIGQLELTGNWAKDLLSVAKSQLGYEESDRNCVLVSEQLNGYTRYGAWFGNPYWDWDDMFVSFCLNYSGIDEDAFPRDSDTQHWVDKLKAMGFYRDAQCYEPVEGDLVFLDTDEDDLADFVGIAAEIGEDALRLIAGDVGEGQVGYLICGDGDAILGYGKLPENPLSEEQWSLGQAVQEMLDQLPDADAIKEALEELNSEGDKAGFEALRQEVISRIEEIQNAEQDLTDDQISNMEGTDRLEELQEACGGETWQELAPLTDDSALLTELAISGVQIDRSGGIAESQAENAIQNGDVIRFCFAAAAESYYSDLNFGEARVKVELVLPLAEEKVRFLLDEMDWLEDAQLYTEERDGVTCQVLTGYKRMAGTEENAAALPGSFTQSVPVQIENMTHGETVHLTIRAAMEFSAWDESCEDHGCEESMTVRSASYTLNEPLPEEERSGTYEEFLARITELAEGELTVDEKAVSAQELLDEIVDAYYEGLLTVEELGLLGDAIREPLGYYAEYATGTPWILGIYSNGLDNTYTVSRTVEVTQTAAVSEELYDELFPSSVQVVNEGGSKTSEDGKVYVSKTISGTDYENVFDITLEIITQDKVMEVYEEPDMAVVVVMDVSNTMNSEFNTDTSSTRYDAAMEAGANFLTQFAENNKGVSKVGYVAFNTSATEIFPLSSCSTTAEANALINEMKTDTKAIVSAYSSNDTTRFTNMEAGLKMAYDMLKNATNEHKYIIFLTDGFPTTYIQSGYTGYNPYNDGATKERFYDNVLSKYTRYGTSYSDTAAIRAREMATSLKADGVTILSIGVDVSGQSLSSYHAQSYNANGFSVVERMNTKSYYQSTGYEIGIDHDDLTTSEPSAAKIETEATYFKNWLKGTAPDEDGNSTGIGSGYYYDSDSADELAAAYEAIFEKIKEINAESAHLDWVAADPMGDMGVHDKEAVDFVGFWSSETPSQLKDALSGTCKDGENYENTATFDQDEQTIHWDLKQSRYVSQSTGEGTTTYKMWLTYRVRLKNEDLDFVELQDYDTNDVTTLTYRLIETSGSDVTISDRKTVEFPIPAVEGYLGELKFKKVDATGAALSGAEFTLSHNVDACLECSAKTDDAGNVIQYASTCAGVGEVTIADQTAVSGEDGMVTFTEIPSGHVYTLTETDAPDGYIARNVEYRVVISYDTNTITVYDAYGNLLEETWDDTVLNEMYYELPETGSTGIQMYTFSGMLLIAVALSVEFYRRRRRGRGASC